jgi:hypothetical protein
MTIIRMNPQGLQVIFWIIIHNLHTIFGIMAAVAQKFPYARAGERIKLGVALFTS